MSLFVKEAKNGSIQKTKDELNIFLIFTTILRRVFSTVPLSISDMTTEVMLVLKIILEILLYALFRVTKILF